MLRFRPVNDLIHRQKFRPIAVTIGKQLLGQLAISGDNGETQCLSMGKSLLAYGKITGGKETRSLVDGIKAEDIQEMAQTIFAPEKLSKLIYI